MLIYIFFAFGDVPKWLRERSAKALFSGSIPLVASMIFGTPGWRNGRREGLKIL